MMKKSTQLKKQLKELRNELADRQEALKKGWPFYLGDPIQPQIWHLETEIQITEFRIQKQLKIETNGR